MKPIELLRAPRLRSLVIGLLVLPLTAADLSALQVRLQLPDKTVTGSASDAYHGQKLATYGPEVWAASSPAAGDTFTRYTRSPGQGWHKTDGASGLVASGIVGVAVDGTTAILSFDGKVEVHYTPAGGFPTTTTLSATGSAAVAVDGPVVAYGAGEGTSGDIHLLEWNGAMWTPLGTVSGPGGLSAFGTAGLGLRGDYLFVGAPQYNTGLTGEVYVFERDRSMTCGEPYCSSGPPLVAPDAEPANWFGTALAVDGDWLAVGAPFDDYTRFIPFPQTIAGTGIVYLYHFNGTSWIYADSLRFAGFAADDHFGWSVDLWNRSLVVGAAYDDIPAEFTRTDMGSAHVFLYDGLDWVEKSFLRGGLLSYSDYAGAAVSIGLYGVQVGAPFSDEGASNGGAIYFFDDALWIFADGFESGDTSAWAP